MPASSDARLLVLHALRVKSFAEVDAVSAQTGLYPSEVRKLLDHLRAGGLVSHREGRITGWTLTPEGREYHGRLVAAEVRDPEVREHLGGGYRRFRQVNTVLLGVCTDWQMRTIGGRHVVNDHTDPVYDDEVIARLERVDEAVQPICADLATALRRFATYGPRLSNALQQVRKGDYDWFTTPIIDSYHTVWFELHEDLLTTLGIERAKEDT